MTTILISIPQQPQRQDSTEAQLEIVLMFANRLGCYDAADAIKTLLNRE